MKKYFKHYIAHMGELLKWRAMDAKSIAEKNERGWEEFHKGELDVYCKVIEDYKAQATAFGISHEDIDLANFDPSIELAILSEQS